MTHTPEAPFEDIVADWFREHYPEAAVSQQVYQPGPRFYVDIVVEFPFATLYIETESRAGEVRAGVAQALGYAAADLVLGIPVVITPRGHLDEAKVRRLRRSATVLIREFDDAEQRFVR